MCLTRQVLLTSDKAAANFSDRSLLKNLGHWLGMITLAKNKPILYTVSRGSGPTEGTSAGSGAEGRCSPPLTRFSPWGRTWR